MPSWYKGAVLLICASWRQRPSYHYHKNPHNQKDDLDIETGPASLKINIHRWYLNDTIICIKAEHIRSWGIAHCYWYNCVCPSSETIQNHADWNATSMGLLPGTRNCGLRMHRECRGIPRYRLQRKPLVSDPGMHYGTCTTHVHDARAVMHVGFANSRLRGKRPRHSRRMRNTQFYVSGKRPMNPTPLLFSVFSRLVSHPLYHRIYQFAVLLV